MWLIFLNAPVLETDSYLELIHRGASPAYSKIRNDTFRTLTTDPLFRRRVSEASLIRLLSAIAWRLHDAREERSGAGRRSLPQQEPSSRPSTGYGSSGIHSASSPAGKGRARALTLTTEGSESSVAAEPGTYVQGMNVLAAPFLYAARSEAEAFVAFHQLLTKECPGYIRGAMDGVHKGLALVDKVLAIVDPKLSLYLLSKSLTAEIYAFPSGSDAVRVHSSLARSPETLGFPLRLWSPSQYIVHRGTAGHHTDTDPKLSEVRKEGFSAYPSFPES